MLFSFFCDCFLKFFSFFNLSKNKFQKEKLVKYVVQQKGGHYGFVNEESKFSIKPKFDNAAEAIPFIDSYLYPVSYNGKWGLLNQDGSYRVLPTLDKCPIPIDKNAVLCHQEDIIFVIDDNQTIEYKLTLDSNPQFTASVLVAYARAAMKMKARGITGCQTVFDAAPADLSAISREDMLAHML